MYHFRYTAFFIALLSTKPLWGSQIFLSEFCTGAPFQELYTYTPVIFSYEYISSPSQGDTPDAASHSLSEPKQTWAQVKQHPTIQAILKYDPVKERKEFISSVQNINLNETIDQDETQNITIFAYFCYYQPNYLDHIGYQLLFQHCQNLSINKQSNPELTPFYFFSKKSNLKLASLSCFLKNRGTLMRPICLEKLPYMLFVVTKKSPLL